MIKLKDFATSMGVTDRAIQKHLKKHESELAGHYERRGNNGTWLDDFACQFISDLMLKHPIAVIDNTQQQEIERLRQENIELLRALNAAKDNMLLMKDELSETKQLLTIAQVSAERTADLQEKAERLQTRADELEQELQAEKTRKIPFSEWWRRK